MRLKSGIKLLAEREGLGEPARKGDRVVYNLKIFLSKGDEVELNRQQAQHLPHAMIRSIDGYAFIDHQIILGSRAEIPGVEYSLVGMKPDGYRKVRVSPHLAYRDDGLGDLIPAGAVLIIELWLRDIVVGNRGDEAT